MPLRIALLLLLPLLTPLLTPAAAAAVGVGKICGGVAGVRCDAGLLCDSPAGACGAADVTGMCVRVGKVCTAIYQPVCGCDGKSYGNDCMRRAARVAKRHEGACQ